MVTSPARRSRGHRAGIDLAQIVDAARSLDPDTLTMRAVADKLGVDRKALNHHITDRDGLLELVALDAFTTHFKSAHLDEHLGWQSSCRAFATALTESLLTIGVLAEYFRPGISVMAGLLEPSEVLLTRLEEAGFDDDSAQRTITVLVTLCVGHARNAAFTARNGEHPGFEQVRRSLEKHAGKPEASKLEHLSRILARPVDAADQRQFDLSIDVFLRGAESLLADSLSIH